MDGRESAVNSPCTQKRGWRPSVEVPTRWQLSAGWPTPMDRQPEEGRSLDLMHRVFKGLAHGANAW